MKHRLELFTDAVLAIILTIMVLDLHVPEAEGWRGLAHLAGPVAVYGVGFMLVAFGWVVHHYFFSRFDHINRRMLWCNFLFLFFSSLVPLFIRIVAEHPHDAAPVVVLIVNCYVAIQWLTMMRLASAPDHRDKPGYAEWMRVRNRAFVTGVPIILASVAVAVFFPIAGLALLAAQTAWTFTLLKN